LLGLEQSEDGVQARADTNIHKREKDRGDRRHDKHHDRRQYHFATRRPNDLRDLAADLLDKLCWIRACHDWTFGCVQWLSYVPLDRFARGRRLKHTMFGGLVPAGALEIRHRISGAMGTSRPRAVLRIGR